LRILNCVYSISAFKKRNISLIIFFRLVFLLWVVEHVDYTKKKI
jgi:hypothetical protein